MSRSFMLLLILVAVLIASVWFASDGDWQALYQGILKGLKAYRN